jgi:hypothetical protein
MSSLVPTSGLEDEALAAAVFLLFNVSKHHANSSPSRPKRVLRDIFPMLAKTLFSCRAYFGKPALPNLCRITQLLLHPIRKPTLDELHGLLNRHLRADANQGMEVIRHDDEVKDHKALRSHVRPQNIDEQRSGPIGLQQPLSHAGFRCNEECPPVVRCRRAFGSAQRNGHNRGWKPRFSCTAVAARLKSCPDTKANPVRLDGAQTLRALLEVARERGQLCCTHLLHWWKTSRAC